MRSTGPVFPAVVLALFFSGAWYGVEAQGIDVAPRSAPPAEHTQIASRSATPIDNPVPLPANADFWVSAQPLPDAPTPALSATALDGASATPGGAAAASSEHHPGERDVRWKTLPRDFVRDQKGIWVTFPSQLAHGHHWVPVLAVAGVTAGLIYADPHIMPYIRSHQKNFDKGNDAFDPMITTGEVILLPASLLAAGYARHDEYQVSTGLMGALAYGDSVTVNLAIKAITRRQRPSDVPDGGSYTGTFFNSGKSPLKGSSFPSGHSTAAFSVATVVAYRYRNHKWVAPLAYGMATAIALSRVATQAHFPSDVFLGSAIGYSVARFQTVRPQ